MSMTQTMSMPTTFQYVTIYKMLFSAFVESLFVFSIAAKVHWLYDYSFRFSYFSFSIFSQMSQNCTL